MKLHRPYVRKSVREEVERRAEKNENGQYLDAKTGKAIEGKYDIGHKYGCENARAIKWAEQQGLTQKEFNDLMNNPDLYQIEDPSSNRSHTYEMKSQDEDFSELMNTIDKSKYQSEALDSNKADKSEMKFQESDKGQEANAEIGNPEGWGESSSEGQGESAGQSM